jgi:2-C-methyl-D-erythritol 4-phosphate cytidylyltransferase
VARAQHAQVVWSIVVAGGSGQRFGEMKQFSALGGRPILEWAVEACRAVSAGVVLVLPAEAARSVGSPGPELHGADVVVAGGATRAESVRRGLAGVPAEAEVIVVHDAARPLATTETFVSVLTALDEDEDEDEDEVAGVVPGLPPSDTIKAVDPGGNVTETLDRSTLVAVQTPQAFRAAALRSAHEHGSGGAALRDGTGAAPATDDAMLVEAGGGRVRVVPGQPDNLKITTADDLEAAERLLSARGSRPA